MHWVFLQKRVKKVGREGGGGGGGGTTCGAAFIGRSAVAKALFGTERLANIVERLQVLNLVDMGGPERNYAGNKMRAFTDIYFILCAGKFCSLGKKNGSGGCGGGSEWIDRR